MPNLGVFPCPSFLGLFENTKENLKHTKDFSHCANPQKTLENKQKTLNKTKEILAVARGPLQERPLQFQHGNVRVKSWQPMSNSRSTSSQPDFVRALGRRKTAQNRQGKSCSEVGQGQLLVNSSPSPHPMEVAGVFLAVVLWQHPKILAAPNPRSSRR